MRCYRLASNGATRRIHIDHGASLQLRRAIEPSPSECCSTHPSQFQLLFQSSSTLCTFDRVMPVLKLLSR